MEFINRQEEIPEPTVEQATAEVATEKRKPEPKGPKLRRNPKHFVDMTRRR